MKSIPIFTAILAAFFFTQCTSFTNSVNSLAKVSKNDPFQETIVESQFFEIDPTVDNVLEGENGTVIVIPKDSYLDHRGARVYGALTIELAEALTLDEMLISNLTTTSHGDLLETGGMIYINATVAGKQVSVDPENPIYIEIPTAERLPGMMLYNGVRDADGNMNWVDPKPLETFLNTVDLADLDFLPKGFEAGVESGMPFRGYTTATSELVDSLYYSFAVSDGSELLEGFVSTDVNEALLQDFSSTPVENASADGVTALDSLRDEARSPCGIDPAIVKVIKSPRFAESLIATREFEARMRKLHEAGRDELLELYIGNLNKNMWEIDSMVWVESPKEVKPHFETFYKQRFTNIEGGARYADHIRKHYRQQLEKTRKALQKAEDNLKKELQKENAKIQRVVENYEKTLVKREAFRMERYGFVATDNGWLNVDRGTVPKGWKMCKLEAQLTTNEAVDLKDFDLVTTYLVFEEMRSIARLNTRDNQLFYPSGNNVREMNMPIDGLASVISVAYQGEQAYIGATTIKTCTETSVSLVLNRATEKEVKSRLKKLDRNLKASRENSIAVDLKYQKRFAEEKRRQRQLTNESLFIRYLNFKAFQSCDSETVIMIEGDASLQ